MDIISLPSSKLKKFTSSFALLASSLFLAASSLSARASAFLRSIVWLLLIGIGRLVFHLLRYIPEVHFELYILLIIEFWSSVMNWRLHHQVVYGYKENPKHQLLLKVPSKTPCTIDIISIFLSVLWNNLWQVHTETNSHI